MADSRRLEPWLGARTWEVELLISGIAVFTMLRLPGQLAEWLIPLVYNFIPPLRWIPVLLLWYGISAALVLGVTFAVHLVLRTHWIALAGMYAAFPRGAGGSRRLRSGPLQRAVQARRGRSAAAAVARASRRASIAFAFGVMVAGMLLGLGVVMGLVFAAVAFLLPASTAEDGDIAILVTLILLMVWFGVRALTRWLDRRWGARLPRGSRRQRALAAVLGVYARLGGLRRFSTARILAAQLGPLRFRLFIAGLVVLALVGTMMSLNRWNLRGEGIGDFALFPDASAQSAPVHPWFYADSRATAFGMPMPYLETRVIEGPYVGLVVPWLAAWDDPALRATCAVAPQVLVRGKQEDADAAALLACLTELHPVHLDGELLADPQYELGIDRFGPRPALVAMIDARALAPGRHEIRVRAGAEPWDAESESQGAHEFRIPFWR